MSSVSIKSFVFIQWICMVVCNWYIDKTCPNIPNAPDANPYLHGSTINHYYLKPRCFAIDIRLNVENIMPDPSFILPETNLQIIKTAISKTLVSYGIYGFRIDIASEPHPFSINNNCPKKDETVRKYILPDFPHHMACNASTLVIDEYTKTVHCEFTTPDSLTYIFYLEYIKSYIEITGYDVIMDVWITNPDRTVTLQSDPIHVANGDYAQVFSFSNTTLAILSQGTTYFMSINIVSGNGVQIGSVKTPPEIFTRAEANACHLGWALGDISQMHYAFRSLCDPANSQFTNVLESTLYQKHSTQTYIPGVSKDGFRRRLNTRKRFPRTINEFSKSGGGATDTDSLHIVYSDGTRQEIADNKVFPSMEQCVAIDQDSLKLFSVGGNRHGKALDRFAMYQINIDTTNNISAHLIRDDLVLDKPRANSSCFYYTPDNTQEYMIVINGMYWYKEYNTNNWYKDIVILSTNENQFNCPKILLKHNVIDTTPFVTDTNDLYLFGGRDVTDAKNYIQSLDLDQVLNSKNKKYIFSTVERMEPMVSPVVSPFIEVVRLDFKPCLMIFGGQKYVNKQWIDVNLFFNTTLQLYCNDKIIKDNHIGNAFTEFDKYNLRLVDDFYYVKTHSNVYINDYKFYDDDIWYGFDSAFKLCFDSLYPGLDKVTLSRILNPERLARNILVESKKHFKQWNCGYSKAKVTDIKIERGKDGSSHMYGYYGHNSYRRGYMYGGYH